MSNLVSTPIETTDPINGRILAVSEDKLQGFHENPLEKIAALAEMDIPTVAERIAAMLRAGTIRRVRQTLMSVNLAKGALVAWKVPADKINAAFDFLWSRDPFSGHIVLRTTDRETTGSDYKLWTTLKVPEKFSMPAHCDLLCKLTGAESYKLMPAKKVFALGVGHVRRRGLPPGSKSDSLAEPHDTQFVSLSDEEWQVLTALKREFTPEEILSTAERSPRDFWSARAAESAHDLAAFLAVANNLHAKKVIGRFSTFLEHVKPNAAGERVTHYNALFHWRVPPGMEVQTGQEVARFHIMTHAYWREGGAEFNNVNIMGVAHGTDKEMVIAHKAAIDVHLAEQKISVSYTNIFWGGRSEIKPSEISPLAYQKWLEQYGV